MLGCPSLIFSEENKPKLYIHQLETKNTKNDFPAQYFDQVLKIVFKMNKNYTLAKRSQSGTSYGKKQIFSFGENTAKAFGYKTGAKFVILGIANGTKKGTNIKLGLFDVDKNKLLAELEKDTFSNDSNKIESLATEMAVSLGGKAKSSYTGKVLTWSAVVGAVAVSTYFVTDIITTKEEEPKTTVRITWE